MKLEPRLPSKDGFVSGYRLPRKLDTGLKKLSKEVGLSKLHLVEIAIMQFLEKREPLEW